MSPGFDGDDTGQPGGLVDGGEVLGKDVPGADVPELPPDWKNRLRTPPSGRALPCTALAGAALAGPAFGDWAGKSPPSSSVIRASMALPHASTLGFNRGALGSGT